MLFVGLWQAAWAGEPAWTIPAAVVDAVRAVEARPIGERIAAATAPFLGLPYLNDAAGEGEGVDPDPPARYDTFDCVSFIEETLGMVLAGDPLGAPEIRDALRYGGKPSYESRNHFMEAEWIPRAVQSGLLVDITDRVGHPRTITKELTPQLWSNWRRRGRFALPDAALPLGSWSVRYLDLGEAAEAAARIPAGSIIVTLRVERAWSPVITTHISLVVDGPQERLMRHATRMGRQTVRDDRLSWYMEHLRDYVNWPALGVAVLYPSEQGPRISSLEADPFPSTPFADAEGEAPHFEPRPIAPFEAGDDAKD